MMQIKSNPLPIGALRDGKKRRKTFGITVHDSINSIDCLHEYCNKNKSTWHFFVASNFCTQTIPLSEVSWHADDGIFGKGNNETISINICTKSDCEGATKKAALLTAALLKKYSLTTKDVYQHYYWSGVNCPKQLRKSNPYSWSEFIERVDHYMQFDNLHQLKFIE